ncbi:MAG: head GIN domain-containing protein [Flavobacteriales bacterium]
MDIYKEKIPFFTKIIGSLLFMAMFIGSCEDSILDDCTRSKGKTVTKERDLSEISDVTLFNDLKLKIEQDSFYSMEVKGGKNLLPRIKTKVFGDSLVIKDNNKCDWVRDLSHKIMIKITVKDLKKVEVDGTGSIKSIGKLDFDNFKFVNHSGHGEFSFNIKSKNATFKSTGGTGDLKLKGNADYCAIYHSGVGFIYGKDFKVNDLNFNHDGLGEIHIKATNRLRGTIKSQGDVYYSGKPNEIDVKVTGQGKLFKE